MSSRTRAPRRRIERVRTQVVQNTVPTAGKNIEVHNAEDSKTLVRTLVDLTLGYKVDNTNDRYDTVDLVLHQRPGNVSVASSILTAVPDSVVPLQEIARWTVPVKLVTRGTDGHWQYMPRVFADIKAMRKFKENDRLALGVSASTNDLEVNIDGVIYAWFKE